MKSLSQTIYDSLIEYADNVAFNFDGLDYTYFQLLNRVAQIQTMILDSNQPSQSIGIITKHDFNTYSTIIACLLSGITYVPIEPSHPNERNKHILDLSRINIIFCSDVSGINHIFYNENIRKIVDSESIKVNNAKPEISETENPAYILFTSGSTGIPKGVPISFQNLKHFIINVGEMEIEINQKSRFLQVFDLTFDLSIFSFLVPLFYGASVYTISNPNFKHLSAIQLIDEQSITHVLSVPSFVSFLKPYYSKIRLPSIKYWLFCGEALKSDLVISWQNCINKSTILNVYGPTEATIFCTCYKCPPGLPKEHHGLISIGKPFKDVRFLLLNENLQLSDNTLPTELCIGGSQLTSGYIENEGKNKTAFFEYDHQLFYRSGDLCLIDKQGDYFFTSRNDTQVKVNGYRIEISEIEFHSRFIPGVNETVIIVSKDSKNDQQILNLAYTAKYEVSKDDIISFLVTKVPPYMLPVHIYYFKAFPYNLNGKIDKKVILQEITK